VALNDITQSDLIDLDDSAYRDYSRSRLARARNQKVQNWRGPVDLAIALFLFMIVGVIVLHERGII
jgi:hypothetical protein